VTQLSPAQWPHGRDLAAERQDMIERAVKIAAKREAERYNCHTGGTRPFGLWGPALPISQRSVLVMASTFWHGAIASDLADRARAEFCRLSEGT
jgi:hypothetical protein